MPRTPRTNPPEDGPQVDRRTLPRERPWLSKPRPSARTGGQVPGTKPHARLMDLRLVSARVPQTTADRLHALAELEGRPLSVMLAVAVTDYLEGQSAETTDAVNRVARRVQAHRLKAERG
jgi:predicted transcriptional regulator